MGAGHDDSELDVRADFEEPDELSNELLVNPCVGGSRVRGRVKEVRSVGGSLGGE